MDHCYLQLDSPSAMVWYTCYCEFRDQLVVVGQTSRRSRPLGWLVFLSLSENAHCRRCCTSGNPITEVLVDGTFLFFSTFPRWVLIIFRHYSIFQRSGVHKTSFIHTWKQKQRKNSARKRTNAAKFLLRQVTIYSYLLAYFPITFSVP